MDLLIMLAGIAVGLAGIWVDWDVSKRFIYYGQKEATDWLKDDEGFMSHWKVGVMTFIKFLPFLLYFHPEVGAWVALWGPIVGAGHLVMGMNNRKNAKLNRLKQIVIRQTIQNWTGTDAELERARFKIIMRNNHTGLWRIPLFGWIQVEADNALEAIPKLRLAMQEWARLPESEAWPDTKFHPKQ